MQQDQAKQPCVTTVFTVHISTAEPHWRNDNLTPTILTTAIYLLAMLFLHIVQKFQMGYSLDSVPMRYGDSARFNGLDSAARDDAGLTDDIVISTNGTTAVRGDDVQFHSDGTVSKGSEHPVAMNKKSPTYKGKKSATKEGSSLPPSTIFGAILNVSCQLLLTYQVGALAAQEIHETRHLVDKLIGVLVMSCATFVLAASASLLAFASSVKSQGTPPSGIPPSGENVTPSSKSSDPIPNFLLIAIVVWAGIWLRVLYSIIA